MEWSQVLTILGSTAGLLIWFRSEARSDMRRCESLIDAIKNEMKDFHGRLCSLEERSQEKPKAGRPKGSKNRRS